MNLLLGLAVLVVDDYALARADSWLVYVVVSGGACWVWRGALTCNLGGVVAGPSRKPGQALLPNLARTQRPPILHAHF